MCPVCWATALASFAILFAISVLTLAATDPLTLALAIALGALSLAHQSETMLVPWWLFPLAMTAIAARILHLAFYHRDRLLVVRLWTRARQIAAARCPTRKTEPSRSPLHLGEGGSARRAG